MASGVTNKGKHYLFDQFLRNATEPSNLYVALVTSAASPTADTNTLSQLTEIANGNGYVTGGFQLTRNSTDFDSLVENDTDDRAEIQVKDVTWTASGGAVPASGSAARWAVLTDDNGTVGSRLVLAWWDLVSDRTISDGQTITLQNLELRAA